MHSLAVMSVFFGTYVVKLCSTACDVLYVLLHLCVCVLLGMDILLYCRSLTIHLSMSHIELRFGGTLQCGRLTRPLH